MPLLSELIRAAQSGDAGAMDALIARYSRPIRQECCKVGMNSCADLSHSDLVQEVLLQAWTKIHQFKGGDDEQHTERAFELWLRKNARTALSNLYRSRSAQKRMPVNGLKPFDDAIQNYGNYLPTQSGPSSIFYRDEDAERLRNAIEQCLDVKTREIVLRHVVDGESFKQIAEQMLLSYDQVRYAFHCAQTELAKCLQ